MNAQNLDELLGTTARMAIVLTLADHQPWTFTSLREETGLADGNLHVQARKLVQAGYLEAEKVPQGNRMVTAFRLSTHGWDRLRAYGQRLGPALGLVASDFPGKKSSPGQRGSSGQNGSTSSGSSSTKYKSNDDSQVW